MLNRIKEIFQNKNTVPQIVKYMEITGSGQCVGEMLEKIFPEARMITKLGKDSLDYTGVTVSYTMIDDELKFRTVDIHQYK